MPVNKENKQRALEHTLIYIHAISLSSTTSLCMGHNIMKTNPGAHPAAVKIQPSRHQLEYRKLDLDQFRFTHYHDSSGTLNQIGNQNQEEIFHIAQHTHILYLPGGLRDISKCHSSNRPNAKKSSSSKEGFVL